MSASHSAIARMFERNDLVQSLATVGLLMATVLAQAQPYPAKPVRIIAPFPAGGSSDLVARIVAQKLTEGTGVQFLVDNRPGAGGTLGTELGARATPDGYTLVIGNISGLAVNPHLFRRLPYDPIRDFSSISLLAVGTTVLVVHPSLPVRSVKELVALAKARPGALNFGSGGTGTPAHLVGELFKSMAHVNIVHVPYKGTGQSINDLLAGQIQLVFASMPVGLPHVKTGRLRGLAVSGEKRSPLAPEYPTVAESGIPGFAFDSWWGLNGPAQMPPEAISRLNALSLNLLKQPDTRERFAALGLEPRGSSPQEYSAFVNSELQKVGRVVRTIGLQPE
jgi:tripartite-type tricarboxylate transporter receptor subunit TctC